MSETAVFNITPSVKSIQSLVKYNLYYFPNSTFDDLRLPGTWVPTEIKPGIVFISYMIPSESTPTLLRHIHLATKDFANFNIKGLLVITTNTSETITSRIRCKLQELQGSKVGSYHPDKSRILFEKFPLAVSD